MKYIFPTINILIVILMAYFCVEMAYTKLTPDTVSFQKDSSKPALTAANPKQIRQTINRDLTSGIVKRNLFGVETKKPDTPAPRQKDENETHRKLQPTELNLKLWGTVTGGPEIYAVIEDKKNRQQSLFEIGDSIEGARIKNILRNQVILLYNGKEQILETETNYKNKSPFETALKKPFPYETGKEQENKSIPVESIPDADEMAARIKFRPHFTDSQPDGLMIYGIRSKSVLNKMGIRNGDIIKDINDIPIVSSEDSQLLFSEIEKAEDTKLTVLRRGKIKELLYQATD